jgi:DNA-binding NtrC family response regulator
MLNILVISDEAEEIYSIFRSIGFSSDIRSESPVKIDPENKRYDLALLDLDADGWKEKLLSLRHSTPIIAFSRPDLRKAIESIKLGASDYLEKPLNSDVLLGIINQYKKKFLEHEKGLGEIIGTSQVMQDVFGLIKKAAACESNVLITGESGTGKELVARAIHRLGERSECPFITINCSAIPDTLLEAELFGFEKGAFTGANYTKRGLLELAHEGTVFLDEIGDVSSIFQAKVLRVLQEGEFLRIGGMKPIRVNLRIISATNRDIQIAVFKKGTFREDLFYRLNVINIHIPPLRERKEDIPLLIEHFIQKHAKKRKDILIKGLSNDAMALLKNYSYPGNVRELENIIERAISFANGPIIMVGDLPDYLISSTITPQKPSTRLKDAINQLERELIITALKGSNGNISRAASALGIYRQQLQRKIKEHKIAT